MLRHRQHHTHTGSLFHLGPAPKNWGNHGVFPWQFRLGRSTKFGLREKLHRKSWFRENEWKSTGNHGFLPSDKGVSYRFSPTNHLNNSLIGSIGLIYTHKCVCIYICIYMYVCMYVCIYAGFLIWWYPKSSKSLDQLSIETYGIRGIPEAPTQSRSSEREDRKAWALAAEKTPSVWHYNLVLYGMSPATCIYIYVLYNIYIHIYCII